MKSECKYSFLEAKTKLEALCAYQERCSFELNAKMISWGLNEVDRNALLADLISNNFLSEERFAEAYTSGKIRIKKWGRIKIKIELKKKQISTYSIQKAFHQINELEYLENLKHLAIRKWEETKKFKSEFERKGKVFRFLLSKGYESDLVSDCLDEISKR